MKFSGYKSLAAALKDLQIVYREVDFVEPVEFVVTDYFREDLTMVMREGVVNNSEFAICENLVYPVLKEVWKKYYQQFVIWSHQFLSDGLGLEGFPEYILAKKSDLGKIVFERPFLLLVEAKQDDFDAAWGQCLAEMVAAQRLNGSEQIPLFGIASNGGVWQFGRLVGDRFDLNQFFYTIQELDRLLSAVNFVFQECDRQLSTLTAMNRSPTFSVNL